MGLVLIPGFMADAGLWDDMAEALSAAGPLVHADLGLDETIPAMARRLLADAPERFVLVGFSMGGYVAREAARIAPERVRGLVLVATSSRTDTEPEAARKRVAVEHVEAGRFGGLSRAAVAASLHPERAGDDALIERVRAMGLRLGREAFLRQSRLERIGDGDRLGAIACPTLVVAAGHDRLRSVAESEALRDGIPGATLEILAQSGHMVPLEAPDALAGLILAWLRGAPFRMTQAPREAADDDGLAAAAADAAFVLALRGRGTRDTAVLRAMEQVPRAAFVHRDHRALARRDLALPLPCGAEMSPPSAVATLLTLLQVEAGSRVLEIGTGSGYVAALLLHLGAGSVQGVERYATLVGLATGNLGSDRRVVVVQGDGLGDLAEAGEGRFDRILVHGSVSALPPRWVALLDPGGRLVAGSTDGRLLSVARTASGPRVETGPALRLAPLVPGRAISL